MPQRDRPKHRALVGHERPAGQELLDEPPDVPRPEREDREDVALVLGEVPDIARRTSGREERSPEQDDDADPDHRSRHSSAEPVAGEEPRRERHDERQRLRLRHERDREHRRGRQRVAAHGEEVRDEPEHDVDRLVLAPPGAHVDHRRVEEDPETRHDRPPRPAPQLPRHEPAQDDVGEARRQLHDRPDRGIGRVRHRPKGRLDGREEPPEVDHDRREREVLVVGVPERPRREAVDPEDELVEVAAQAIGREKHRPDRAGQQQSDREDQGISAATILGRDPPISGRGHRVQAGRVAQ